MATRRKLLVGMGVGAMTSLLTGLYVSKSSSEAPWWLLGELKAGSFLGKGWFLSDISPVERGASVISLRKKTGEEACPFNYLYWNFLAQHRDKLANNPRMAMMYRVYDKMTDKNRQEIKKSADAFLSLLDG